MKICICTIIKDELEEYLDDFINYHLNLGIDHFFFFEDINSSSHQNMLSKYSSKYVTLMSVKDVLRKEELEYVTKYHGIKQILALKEGMEFIKSNYDFDWCFAIDIDEYITLKDNSQSIKVLLWNYADYDVIRMDWQNYNANGLIYKPDYSKQKIEDIYTQPCIMSTDDNPYMVMKNAFNMKTFKPYCLKNVHQIHEFVSSIANASKDIYIRHYITKSWEEYVWKLKSRGMFNSGHRNFEHFFDFNPDLKSQRGVLMESLEE